MAKKPPRVPKQGRRPEQPGFRRVEHNYPGGARIYEFDDGRQLIQLFYSKQFQNYGMNPELLMHAWRFPKGKVRVQMIPPEQATGGWNESPPMWEAAVPITTFMRKIALDGDWFAKLGFYRLYDHSFLHIKNED